MNGFGDFLNRIDMASPDELLRLEAEAESQLEPNDLAEGRICLAHRLNQVNLADDSFRIYQKVAYSVGIDRGIALKAAAQLSVSFQRNDLAVEALGKHPPEHAETIFTLLTHAFQRFNEACAELLILSEDGMDVPRIEQLLVEINTALVLIHPASPYLAPALVRLHRTQPTLLAGYDTLVRKVLLETNPMLTKKRKLSDMLNALAECIEDHGTPYPI